MPNICINLLNKPKFPRIANRSLIFDDISQISGKPILFAFDAHLCFANLPWFGMLQFNSFQHDWTMYLQFFQIKKVECLKIAGKILANSINKNAIFLYLIKNQCQSKFRMAKLLLCWSISFNKKSNILIKFITSFVTINEYNSIRHSPIICTRIDNASVAKCPAGDWRLLCKFNLVQIIIIRSFLRYKRAQRKKN